MRGALWGAAFALAALVCDRPATPVAPPPARYVPIRAESLAGCYQLAMSPWNPPRGVDQWGWYKPPSRFELTLENVLYSIPVSYRIRPKSPDSQHEFGSIWQVSGPLEATLNWSTGFVGVTATVRKESKSGALVGTARTFTDVVPSPYSTATLTARPIPCPPDSDLKVTAKMPDEATGTMHYAEQLKIGYEDADPLVIDGPVVPIPGPHFRLNSSVFLLLGWSSQGGGMQSIHAMLIRIQNNAVRLDGELTATTDRGSAGLLVRLKPWARIGLPEPPSDFVHDPDEWSLIVDEKTSLDLKRMRKLKFETIQPHESDVFFNGAQLSPPPPKRVAWIGISATGFVMVNRHR